ncbi:MAG: hypothetical protein Q8P16_00830 [bacterium]|nr:hypothetical protein [bacterium]
MNNRQKSRVTTNTNGLVPWAVVRLVEKEKLPLFILTRWRMMAMRNPLEDAVNCIVADAKQDTRRRHFFGMGLVNLAFLMAAITITISASGEELTRAEDFLLLGVFLLMVCCFGGALFSVGISGGTRAFYYAEDLQKFGGKFGLLLQALGVKEPAGLAGLSADEVMYMARERLVQQAMQVRLAEANDKNDDASERELDTMRDMYKVIKFFNLVDAKAGWPPLFSEANKRLAAEPDDAQA